MSRPFPDLPDPAFCFRVTVCAEQKEWLTSNKRLFWTRKAELTRAWRMAAFSAARTSGIARMEKAWVLVDLLFADNRRRDPANWYPTVKACVDGFVDAGLFADDDSKHLIGPDMRVADRTVAPAERGLTFLIYPMEGKQ